MTCNRILFITRKDNFKIEKRPFIPQNTWTCPITEVTTKHLRRGKETVSFHCVVPIAFLVQTWWFKFWKMIFLKGFERFLYMLQLIIVIICRVSDLHVCRAAMRNRGGVLPNTARLHPCKLKPFLVHKPFYFSGFKFHGPCAICGLGEGTCLW
jgi:hypothetical protein